MSIMSTMEMSISDSLLSQACGTELFPFTVEEK